MSAPAIFCLSGVGNYTDDAREKRGISNLSGVPAEIAIMRRTLTSLGLVEHLSFDEDERDHNALDLGLTGEVPPGVEFLVIYCTGHGRLRSGRYQLLLPQGNWFHPAKFMEALEEPGWSSLREVLLIVDACSAEPGVDAAWEEARKINTRTSKIGFWGIGASRRLETARQRSFATAFAEAVDRAARPSWTTSHLDPGAIASAVNRTLAPGQTVWLAEGHPAQPCRVLPNPRYQDQSLPTNLPLPSTWATAARGVATPDLPGFFFTGRNATLRALREHLMCDDGDPIAVVSGKPGAGRSALLGHLVLTIHERGRRALPGYVRQTWPELPVTIAAGRGDPTQVIRRLNRELGGSGNGQNLSATLRSTTSRIAIVLDDLDETVGPEPWAHAIETIRSVPGVRLVIGLSAGSTILRPESARTHDLGELTDVSARDVQDYLALQVRLAVPGAPEEKIRAAVDVLAERLGTEFEVAVAVTAIPRSPHGGMSVDSYLAWATKAVDMAAHRVCRRRLETALTTNAGSIVSALSALCDYDKGVALPAAEWAATASIPDRPGVDVHDIATAARLIGSLAEERPAPDGTPRWRARFGYPDAGGYTEPEVFLSRLPQVANWEAVNWPAVDPGVLVLVARAAALGMVPGRLIDDPAFLLGAPATVVSKALQQHRTDRDERARRSRMWRLIPQAASTEDRALLLRIGAERFDVKPIMIAFDLADRTTEHRWRSASAVNWVQPDRLCSSPVIGMATTGQGSRAAVITVHDDNSLAFWDPSNGTSIRQRIKVPGVPKIVTAAVVQGHAVALVATYQGEIWLVPCHESAAPTPVPALVPLRSGAGNDARTISLLVSLHSSGQVAVASGKDVWAGELGSGEAMRKLATMDSMLLSVHTAGPDVAPVAWVVPESGRARALHLRGRGGPAVALFPVPRRPLTTAISRNADRALIVDVSGELHLRGTSADEGIITEGSHSPDIRAAAINATTAVVAGGPAGRAGWLGIYDLSSRSAPVRVPLDDPAVSVAFHGDDEILVARTVGLLSMKRSGHHPASVSVP